MADRPIIFSAPMVRALLDGRKTQTRRVLGNSGPGRGRSNIFSAQIGWSDSYVLDPGNAGWRERDTPYAPGDRLWVREAFSYESLDVDRNGFMPPWYWADGNPASGDFTRPKPSIHMPRWASRLTLTVTDVLVQRVQEISEADAMAEGVQVCNEGHNCPRGPHGGCCGNGYDSARDSFRDLWNSINGPEAWDANPWVAAISFTVHRCNIDTMEEGTW